MVFASPLPTSGEYSKVVFVCVFVCVLFFFAKKSGEFSKVFANPLPKSGEYLKVFAFPLQTSDEYSKVFASALPKRGDYSKVVALLTKPW